MQDIKESGPSSKNPEIQTAIELHKKAWQKLCGFFPDIQRMFSYFIVEQENRHNLETYQDSQGNTYKVELDFQDKRFPVMHLGKVNDRYDDNPRITLRIDLPEGVCFSGDNALAYSCSLFIPQGQEREWNIAGSNQRDYIFDLMDRNQIKKLPDSHLLNLSPKNGDGITIRVERHPQESSLITYGASRNNREGFTLYPFNDYDVKVVELAVQLADSVFHGGTALLQEQKQAFPSAS